MIAYIWKTSAARKKYEKKSFAFYVCTHVTFSILVSFLGVGKPCGLSGQFRGSKRHNKPVKRIVVDTTLPTLVHFFRPHHGKIHLTSMLLCAVIIITPKLPIYQCNANNCCKWDIIRFRWTFSSKNPVCAKILQWMVLLPLLGVTLNAWFTTTGMWAENCTHM